MEHDRALSYTRLLNKEKFDAQTIPKFVIKLEHAVVLATGKLKHNASIAKRRIVFRR